MIVLPVLVPMHGLVLLMAVLLGGFLACDGLVPRQHRLQPLADVVLLRPVLLRRLRLGLFHLTPEDTPEPLADAFGAVLQPGLLVTAPGPPCEPASP